MAAMPKDEALESTLSLLSEGYLFISNRCRRYRSDAFETRLLFQKTICMTGEEAAKTFYDPARFQRANAAPMRLMKTLLGEGGVQSLDGETHQNRKQMFMSLMSPERIRALAELTAEQWRIYIKIWESLDSVVLFDQVRNCSSARYADGRKYLIPKQRWTQKRPTWRQ